MSGHQEVQMGLPGNLAHSPSLWVSELLNYAASDKVLKLLSASELSNRLTDPSA